MPTTAPQVTRAQTITPGQGITHTALSLVFHTDPGHGWLQVPMADVQRLGIADKISRCSYRDGGMAYLEEDCDAPRFLQAAEAAGWKVKLTESNTNGESRIRRLSSFSA